MVLTLMLKKGHSRQDCGPKSKNYNICSKKKSSVFIKRSDFTFIKFDTTVISNCYPTNLTLFLL